MVSFLISVMDDEDLLMSVLECLEVMILVWKRNHLSNTEDDTVVRLSSKDKAEGLAIIPKVAKQGSGGPAAVPAEVPATVLVRPHPADDEVVVQKRALKWVKQQVSVLLCGENLPEGAQASEVAEVPYQVPAVPREAKDCLVCQQSFITHYRLMVHIGAHQGEK